MSSIGFSGRICGSGGCTRSPSFPVFAPLGFIARMRPGDPHDPLLRQVLPIIEEIEDSPGFVVDPVDDAAARLQPGLLQKYAGRVLMITTGRCAIHCRYCFRRHYPYSEGPRAVTIGAHALIGLRPMIRSTKSCFSGGDPLTIVDHQLAELAERIAAIPACPPAANSYPTADCYSGTSDRFADGLAARHAVDADYGRSRESSGRNRRAGC